MSDGGSNASAGIAAASAAIAVAAAAEAKRQRCLALMVNYVDRSATVEQKREYADCVYCVFPMPASGGETIFYKFLIVAVFLGIGFGAWKGPGIMFHSFRDPDLMERIMCGLAGGLIAAVAIFAVIAACASIMYLFSSNK